MPADPMPALSHGGAVRGRGYEAAQIPYPRITSDRAIVSDQAITIGSIERHRGLCFAVFWFIACASATRLLCRKSVSCERVHMPWG
jgi:hypothetical protein